MVTPEPGKFRSGAERVATLARWRDPIVLDRATGTFDQGYVDELCQLDDGEDLALTAILDAKWHWRSRCRVRRLQRDARRLKKRAAAGPELRRLESERDELQEVVGRHEPPTLLARCCRAREVDPALTQAVLDELGWLPRSSEARRKLVAHGRPPRKRRGPSDEELLAELGPRGRVADLFSGTLEG